jgi:hypothetical protein
MHSLFTMSYSILDSPSSYAPTYLLRCSIELLVLGFFWGVAFVYLHQDNQQRFGTQVNNKVTTQVVVVVVVDVFSCCCNRILLWGFHIARFSCVCVCFCVLFFPFLSFQIPLSHARLDYFFTSSHGLKWRQVSTRRRVNHVVNNIEWVKIILGYFHSPNLYDKVNPMVVAWRMGLGFSSYGVI